MLHFPVTSAHPQADVLVANSKVAALEAALAARSVEQVAMRRHLHAARQALDPHIIQARADSAGAARCSQTCMISSTHALLGANAADRLGAASCTACTCQTVSDPARKLSHVIQKSPADPEAGTASRCGSCCWTRR